MIIRDLLAVATGNLWRMKLRAFLTISGVVIAIAAFVAMLSFGAGMQKNIAEQFNELGLFSTIQIYPRGARAANHTDKAAVLDDHAVAAIAALPGVQLAYPFDEFSVTVTVADTQITTEAQPLPTVATRTKAFSRLLAGKSLSSDSTHEALVTEEFMQMLKINDPDSLLGRQLIVSVKVSSLDSAVARVPQSMVETIDERAREIRFDSLRNKHYLERIVRRELQIAMSGFVDGFMNARATVSDTLNICGVLEGRHGGPLRIKPVVFPIRTGKRFSSAGYSGDPIDMFTSLNSGTLFASSGDTTGKSYPKVTLNLDQYADYESVSDTIEALGYRTFSFAKEFKEIRRFFIYFDLALAVIGLIALITASLGIVNTMIMSIIERTREIGVLKSLGADERDIRVLFLVESGLIGAIGAIFGILLGWTISRVASAIARIIMERREIPDMDLFTMPPWLVLTAFLFAVAVSLAAGYYPASRAARVDPVEALHTE
ncbi:MAG: ABC transporter permease [Candidatus Zixiibacteriota bacterium]|nr:MAG: ABC transporter permease [candidate division Zixibacteria bacterium]